MRELTIDDFARLAGQAVRVDAANGSTQLRVVEVQELPGAARAAGGFRVELHGPLQQMLPQGTYLFHLGGEPSQVFIVPVGPGDAIMRYEAIFY